MKKYITCLSKMDWELSDEGFVHSGAHTKGQKVLVEEDFVGALIQEGKVSVVEERATGMYTLEEANALNADYAAEEIAEEEKTVDLKGEGEAPAGEEQKPADEDAEKTADEEVEKTDEKAEAGDVAPADGEGEAPAGESTAE